MIPRSSSPNRHIRFARVASLGAFLFANFSAIASAAQLTPCFTPGEDCVAFIVRNIETAKSELLVQAYGFTSTPIIEAIANAKQRGVSVKVILDKSNERGQYTGATYLKNHDIEVLIDDKVAIAHNKVMVIDGAKVITGSFNFTQAAQLKNAENVLLITDDEDIADAYAVNWYRRAAQSRPYNDFRHNAAAAGSLKSNQD
jgi:phosphatidylserine/phosphatidylglycerophosphate/cardiolipin synthase-like enzyme